MSSTMRHWYITVSGGTLVAVDTPPAKGAALAKCGSFGEAADLLRKLTAVLDEHRSKG